MVRRSIRMRFCRCAAVLVPALLLTASTAGATDRDYLRTKLSFRYVATPNTVTSTPAVLDNAAVGAGTESGGFWTNGSVAGLQGLRTPDEVAELRGLSIAKVLGLGGEDPAGVTEGAVAGDGAGEAQPQPDGGAVERRTTRRALRVTLFGGRS